MNSKMAIIATLLALQNWISMSNPVKGNPTRYRIISGENYDISLSDEKKLLYFVPLNFRVPSEAGLGIAGPEQKLQPNEVPATLHIGGVGMAVVGAIGQSDLFVSLFVSGALPSPCHAIRVETTQETTGKNIVRNTLLFTGVERTVFCATKIKPVEASFILGEAIPKNKTIEKKVNHQPFAKIQWDGVNLTVIRQNRQWFITRLPDIFAQRPINRQWVREWREGIPLQQDQLVPVPEGQQDQLVPMPETQVPNQE